MAKDAVVFPGQGSQRLGMALDFVDRYDEAKQTFVRANEVLPFDLWQVVGEDEARLNLTEYTQPCILTAEIAMFRVLQAHFGFAPVAFGGHSLGEYSALVAAGVLPLSQALSLVALRGRLMQRAVPAGAGAMAAVIQDGLQVDEVRVLAEKEGVDVANDNAPTQLVISGESAAVERVCGALQPLVDQGMRLVPLTVSAPFHSRLMAPIEPEFRAALEAVAGLNPGKAKAVASNLTGAFHSGDRADLVESLTRQIGGTVRWRDNMNALTGVADRIVEVGPNRPLRGFFKSMGTKVQAVVDVRSAAKVFGTTQEVT